MKIFVDFDDTMVRSSESVINILNCSFGLTKTVEDLRDYGYCSIYKKTTVDIVNGIYSSQELFDNLEFFAGCKEALFGNEVIVCSCGSSENIKKKREFLSKYCPEYYAMFVNTDYGKSGKNKSEFDMLGAIQIDDRYDNLKNTNAKIKILFKNFNNFPWQKIENNSEVYVVDTWEEIKQIIDWSDKNDD